MKNSLRSGKFLLGFNRIQRVALAGWPLLFCCFFSLRGQVNLQITEIFSGQTGPSLTADWFEIKNGGKVAWTPGSDPDLYYDDESASATEATPIQGLSAIPPGGYAIVLITDTEADVAAFRSAWSPVVDLKGIPIGYTAGAGLGAKGDAVNLWIGDPAASKPVDSETYPATDQNDGQSYDVELAAFSVAGNASGAVPTVAMGGDKSDVPNIASPGNRGPVKVDPKAPAPSVDTTRGAFYFNLPSKGPMAIGLDVNDPSDPTYVFGIPLLLSDADTPLEAVALTAVSDNQAVAPDVNLILGGSGANYTLKIKPVAAGYADITVTAVDSDGRSGVFIVHCAVSDAAVDPATTRFHAGASDGSTALAIDGDHMWAADDENQTIRLYSRRRSGMPLYSVDIGQYLPTRAEIDLESSFRSGNTLFWMSSQTNDGRSVLFSTTESGSGAAAKLTFKGYYNYLRTDLINWDKKNGHGLGENHFDLAKILEIEGMAADPKRENGALLAFRSPLIGGKALVVPVTNLQTIVAEKPAPNSAVFGVPFLLDLEGHSFRSMDCNENGCLIVAGPAGSATDFRLFTWSGDPADAPELRAADLTAQTKGSSIEGIVALPAGRFLGAAGDGAKVQLIVDTGTFPYYHDGVEAKGLPRMEWKKFRSEWATLGPVEMPEVVAKTESDAGVSGVLKDEASAPAPDLQITEIWPGQNGSDVTADWFEATNAGNAAWVRDLHGDLYFDDESQDPTAALPISGLSDIQPGESVIILLDKESAVSGFSSVWSAVYDMSGVRIGWVDGAGLGQGGDAVALFMGSPSGSTLADYERYPAAPSGLSYDLVLGAFSRSGAGLLQPGSNMAIATTATGGVDGWEPAVGSPGNRGPLATMETHLQITEIFSGQAGADLTPDWFEIKNSGNKAWISGVDPDLYYDDESASAAEAALINGIAELLPGASAIVLITDNASDITTFVDVWSQVIDLTGVGIGYANGAGLGGGGDVVSLWMGDPKTTQPIARASYPATDSHDGRSYDVEHRAFSEAGNANGAVQTVVLGGDRMNAPNVGSPGNKGPVLGMVDVINAFQLAVYPNPRSGLFTVEFPGNVVIETAQVLDITGKELFAQTVGSSGRFEMNLSHLPPSVYYIQVQGAGGKAVRSIVKH